MQYNIFESDGNLAIELVFNNNLSRILSVESIVAKILMSCKRDIDEMLGGNPYDVAFNVWKIIILFMSSIRAIGVRKSYAHSTKPFVQLDFSEQPTPTFVM